MLYGMRMVSGVVGAIVMSTAPAVTAAASIVFMGDKPTWRKLFAIALAVLGVLILHVGGVESGGRQIDNDHLVLGSLMIFCAVCCESVYTLLGKKISESIDPVIAAFLASVLALPLFLPFALWQWGSFSLFEVSARAWFALGWYGAGTLALGTWLWYSGVRKAEGAVAAGFMGVMPVSALVLSYVLLGERFEKIHLAGFLVVFTGVALISWEHARMERQRSSRRHSTRSSA
jgi:drug/metabolite transporter (DMT)-like permease